MQIEYKFKEFEISHLNHLIWNYYKYWLMLYSDGLLSM